MLHELGASERVQNDMCGTWANFRLQELQHQKTVFEAHKDQADFGTTYRQRRTHIRQEIAFRGSRREIVAVREVSDFHTLASSAQFLSPLWEYHHCRDSITVLTVEASITHVFEVRDPALSRDTSLSRDSRGMGGRDRGIAVEAVRLLWKPPRENTEETLDEDPDEAYGWELELSFDKSVLLWLIFDFGRIRWNHSFEKGEKKGLKPTKYLKGSQENLKFKMGEITKITLQSAEDVCATCVQKCVCVWCDQSMKKCSLPTPPLWSLVRFKPICRKRANLPTRTLCFQKHNSCSWHGCLWCWKLSPIQRK